MDCSKSEQIPLSRRLFLSRFGLSAGAAAAACGLPGCAASRRIAAVRQPPNVNPGGSRVSFATGFDRRQIIHEAMSPFRENLAAAIRGRQVIIKLNCVGQEGKLLMVTHPDAVRGVLDFLEPICDRTVIIGETPVQNNNPERTFETFGYLPLEREYNARCVDLNDASPIQYWVLDNQLNPRPIRIAPVLTDPDNFVISVTRLKTHNCVVATLSLKNVVMGAPIKIPRLNINDKRFMHGSGDGPNSMKIINLNLFQLAHRIYPDFAVIDGVEGVDGNGPANGDPVDHGVALAGHDYIAVDRIGVELMGIDWNDIGYLSWAGDGVLGNGSLDRITVTGGDYRKHIRKYRLHDNIESQLGWKKDIALSPLDELKEKLNR